VNEKSEFSPIVGLILGVAAASTGSTFIRLAQESMPSLSVAAWRLTLGTLILAPFAIRATRDEWRRLSVHDWALIAASGLFLAVHFYTWITSLALTSVAASVVLVSTNPIFVGVISHLFLKEKLTRAMVGGLIISVLGSAVIGLEDTGAGNHRLLGDALALAGAAAVAAYMLIGRSLRTRLSLLGYVFPVYSVAALALLLTAFAVGTPLYGYPSRAWLWLFLVALIPQVIGHTSLNWALGHLSATYVALAVLAEPIGSTLLAWAILQEPPTWQSVLGGILILMGIMLATRPRTAETASQTAA
jgi:drug/metabolite transporter (DMT)-like permease